MNIVIESSSTVVCDFESTALTICVVYVSIFSPVEETIYLSLLPTTPGIALSAGKKF